MLGQIQNYCYTASVSVSLFKAEATLLHGATNKIHFTRSFLKIMFCIIMILAYKC